MKKIIVILLLLTGVVTAQDQGGSAGAFLRSGWSAEAMSMGGVQTAWTEPGGASFFYNPALLPMLENKVVSFSTAFMALDRNMAHIGVSLPLQPTGGVSLNWIHAGVKDIRSYNSYGEDTGELNYGDEAFYTSFSQVFKEKYFVGISFKLLWEHFGDGTDEFSYKSIGKAFDLGFLAKLPYDLAVGVAIRNLGGTVSSNTNDIYDRGMEIEEKLPVYYSMGVNYITPIENLTVEMDVQLTDLGQKDILTGLQYNWHEVFIRAGLQDTRFHAGAGFYKKITPDLTMGLDYAFVPEFVGEGATHLFSWKFMFDN